MKVNSHKLSPKPLPCSNHADPRGVRLVCRTELWGHEPAAASSPPALTSLWTSVVLSLPFYVYFMGKLETEFWKPGWDETHQKAGTMLPPCHKNMDV